MRALARLASRSLFGARNASHMASARIHLTETESELCTLLDECSNWIQKEQPDHPFVECRIAGGWVRDKLLGLESNDIDIALSSMMGVAFAENLVQYMESQGKTMRAPAKVARNPDQSKHLETAMVNVLGFDIDVVNLRSEVYAEGSRIPSEITFGTPLQDALRRDITINSLFYNVHSRSVEDFTEKGLADLKAGIIRTPLAPKETFMDDPLRVLRVVRFASRYGYTIEESVRQAILDPDIQAAVRSKISRERVGVELDKMLKAKNPLLSLEMIEDLSLHESIFWLPPPLAEQLSGATAPRLQGLHAAKILNSFLEQGPSPTPSETPTESSGSLPRIHPIMLGKATSPDVKRRLFLAAALTPYKGLTLPDKKRLVPATETVIREGLKLGTQNHYMDGIPALFDAHLHLSRPLLSRFIPATSLEPSSSSTSPSATLSPALGTTLRSTIGLTLREKSVRDPNTGSEWSSSVLFSLVLDLIEEGAWDNELNKLDEDKSRPLLEMYNAFAGKVEELNLHTAIDDPPLLNGREVCTALSISPGPQMSLINALIIEWQLSHPELGKEECIEWLKGEQAAGRLPAAPAKQQRVDDGKRKAGQEGKPGKKAKKAE
ncbi:hypothetical protein DL93DRAFT_2130122 [Clavulina sp. PMI_390]|nr:hypothetical protein DL93DRAFT_2130122 [Clavulina sp. PMI_390]